MEKISRRKFLKGASIAGSSLILPNTSFPLNLSKYKNKNVNGNKRNVLLIISDDHGIDQLGCYGNQFIETPNLDKMANEGIRFTNAYAVAPSCSASRSSLLTGMYTHQNGQYGHQHSYHHFSLFDHIETIPSLLKINGYTTGLIGKLHVSSNYNLDFDFSVSGKEILGNRDAKKIADIAGEFFNKNNDNPFFLMIGFSDPHRQSPTGKGKSQFANDQKYENVLPRKYNPEEVIVPDYLPDINEVREELADQYESISRMDQSIGWILENLRKSNLDKNTLVIYLSDNGIPFPGAKTNMYDSGLRMPMIINVPNLELKNHVNNSMISFIDVLPTILDWTKTEKSKNNIPGQSFLNIMEEKDCNERNEVFGSHTFHEITMYYPMRTIRTKRYRYILNLFPELEFPFATDLYESKTWQEIQDKKILHLGKREVKNYLYRPKEELYDILVDPAESVNLAYNSKYENILIELRTKLNEMRHATNDPWLINNNYELNNKIFPRN